MARKSSVLLKGKQLTLDDHNATGLRADMVKAAEKSWCVVGGDTSMTALAFTAMGYDAKIDKLTEVQWEERRWLTEEDDYFQRLADAANAHNMVLEVLRKLWVIDPSRVYIFIEEPVPMGMMKSGRVKFDSGWIKQQCEVSGAVIGSLYRYGFENIWQINNQQWKKTLRDEGVTIRKMPEGKWDVKEWAVQSLGLPELPDLVKAKTGGKVPRPTEGFGARAKAVQPDDVYDAAACMIYGLDYIEEFILKGD